MDKSMTKTILRCIGVLIILLAFGGGAAVLQAAEIAVKDGQKIAFLGDSITANGWSNQTGYVNLTIAGLKANGIRVFAIPAGIGGHKSNQMLEHLKRDVLDKKPDMDDPELRRERRVARFPRCCLLTSIRSTSLPS